MDIAEIINALIQSVADAISAAIDFLPLSPFKAITTYLHNNSQFSTVIKFINWIVPFGEMIAVLEVWVIAIGLWYIFSILLRWLKAVE